MTKIVRAFVEEAPKAKLSLLKAVERVVSEGSNDALRDLAGGPDRATSDEKSETLSTNINKIVDELLNTTDDRYVIFCSLGFLSKYYLKNGGGQGAIEQITDDKVLQSVAAFKAEGANFDLVKMNPKFQFTDLINTTDASYNSAVILDIPKQLSADLEKAKSASDNTKLRETLTLMMSHKYYVMSISVPKAKKISADMDKNRSDLDKQVEIFNPDIILNYPTKNILDAAKIEWKRTHGDKAAQPQDTENKQQSSQDEEQKDDENKESAVAKTPSGGLDLNKSIFDAILVGQGDADKIAKQLFFTLNKHFDLHTVENAIIELTVAFGGGGVLGKLNNILTSEYSQQWERKQPAGDKSKPQAEEK